MQNSRKLLHLRYLYLLNLLTVFNINNDNTRIRCSHLKIAASPKSPKELELLLWNFLKITTIYFFLLWGITAQKMFLFVVFLVCIFHIWTGYGDKFFNSPYLVWTRENAEHKNSIYGKFSGNGFLHLSSKLLVCFTFNQISIAKIFRRSSFQLNVLCILWKLRLQDFK